MRCLKPGSDSGFWQLPTSLKFGVEFGVEFGVSEFGVRAHCFRQASENMALFSKNVL
jgi:hypothetical protein